MGWLDRIELQLRNACNGDVSRTSDMVSCRMDNGFIKIFETPLGTKTLAVSRGGDIAKIESDSSDPYEEPVVAKSQSGSLLFLTRRGKNPSVIIKQEGRIFGEIGSFAEADKISLTVTSGGLLI